MKRCIGILLVTVCAVTSCKKDTSVDSSLPTATTLTGYWMLTGITNNGQNMPFSDYPVLRTPPGVENVYFNFNGDNSLDYFFDVSSIIRYGGTWALDRNFLNAKFTYVGTTFDAKYEITSFSNTQITLVDQSVKQYALTYTRLAESDFPSLAFSATVNGTAFKPTGTPAYYYPATGNIELNASNSDVFMQIVLTKGTSLTAGTYPIDGPSVSVVYTTGNFATSYNLVSGSLTIVKIQPEYISITFNMVMKDNSTGNIATFTNGIYKYILEPIN